MRSQASSPFVILALPRSRTRWLAGFLTYNDWYCGHEELRHCRSLDDVASWLAQPLTGTAETAGATFWRLLPRYAPTARVVTVRRPVPAVMASLWRAGTRFDEREMQTALEHADAKLNQLERRLPDVMSVRYDDLADEEVCARIFEYCLGLPHDPEWWRHLDQLNLQVSIPQQMRYYEAHQHQVHRLAALAKQRILSDMQRRPLLNGVSFQREGWDEWYADATQLLGDHLAAVGDTDFVAEKNLPVMRQMAMDGAMHIMTARYAGVLAGYVMHSIGQDYDRRNALVGEQVFTYADPRKPGLGLKLQRAAIAELREAGVRRILMQAPPGSRLGSFYRRLGAIEGAQLYVLET